MLPTESSTVISSVQYTTILLTIGSPCGRLNRSNIATCYIEITSRLLYILRSVLMFIVFSCTSTIHLLTIEVTK